MSCWLIFICIASIGRAPHSAFPIATQDPPREDETHIAGDIGQRIAEYIEQAESRGFSGAVLAARSGQVVAAIGAGSADLEGQVPITPATLFEIASLTKQFTAAAVMRLVEDGRLSLDDSIAARLPGVPENCATITVEHLLRHTSGIPGSNSRGRGEDIADVLDAFLEGGPQHTPGTHWEYWNQGYALLSEIITRASESSYTDYCREALFAPAGMKATCFTGDEAAEGAVVAIGRSARGEPRSALEHPYGSYGFQYRGMGGVVTTVWDLWRWDRALHGDAVLSAESRSRVFQPGLGDYGLGWFVRRNPIGRLVQSHGGGVRGFICEMRRFPETDAMLVILSNRDDSPIQHMADAVEAMLFEEPVPDEGGARTDLGPLDRELQKAVAGEYKDDRGNLLVIEADGGATVARLHWSPPNGPVTRATLGTNEAGEIALGDGVDLHPVLIERGSDGSVGVLSILGRAFTRISD